MFQAFCIESNLNSNL